MATPLFTQPSASKEELANACNFIQAECNCSRRPYDMFSVACGGLRPLYSGAPIEAELLASITSLLSPTLPYNGSWHRQPSARYFPAAQEALFKCGGLDLLVASLGYPSAINKPAAARCIALAVGMQPSHIARAVELGVLSSLSDSLSNTLKSGIFHNNCVSFAMAIEVVVGSSSKLQSDADAAGLCALLVNAVLTSISGNSHEVVHFYFWAIAAMCHGNASVISSFARAGAPGAAVRALASCSKMLTAEAALDVLSLFTLPPETSTVRSVPGASSVHELSSSAAFSQSKLAASALLTSDQAVARLAAFARSASKHGRFSSVQTALAVMLAVVSSDFNTAALILERTSAAGSDSLNPTGVASSGSALVQSCIASLMQDRFTQLCTQLLAKLVPISVCACEVFNRGGISVLFACLHSKHSVSMLKCTLSTLAVLASHHQQQFVSALESAQWCEISVAIDAVLQRLKGLREHKKQQHLLSDVVRLLQSFCTLPISFHFRMMSFILSSKAIETLLFCIISPHICSNPEMRSSILSTLQFVLTLMDFDMSIKPVRDNRAAPARASAATAVLDGEYQSATSLVDVAPLIPEILTLFSSCISAISAVNQGTQYDADRASSLISSNDEQRAILLCILKVLTFLVDNPLAADVTGAAGGVELLVKLFLFGEDDHKAAVLVVLRMLHAHNDMNRQILARLIGKLPHSTKTIGKLLLKDHQPWLRSPPKSTSPAATSSLPSAFKSQAPELSSNAKNESVHAGSRKPRSSPLRGSSTAPSHSQSAALPPYLLPTLSKIFDSYSSSDRMSAKHLRKFCVDFALKEQQSRALLRSYTDMSATSGDELSLNKFVEAICAACSSLHISPNIFLCDIGAKNARAVSDVVDAARERSLISQRLEQTKRAICLHVDGWKDRQFAKMRILEHSQQHNPEQVSHAFGAQTVLKSREPHNRLPKVNHPPRSRSVQAQLKQLQPTMQRYVSQPQRSRPSADEAALWAEFGCMYAK